jgi:hypothetical protein
MSTYYEVRPDHDDERGMPTIDEAAIPERVRARPPILVRLDWPGGLKLPWALELPLFARPYVNVGHRVVFRLADGDRIAEVWRWRPDGSAE